MHCKGGVHCKGAALQRGVGVQRLCFAKGAYIAKGSAEVMHCKGGGTLQRRLLCKRECRGCALQEGMHCKGGMQRLMFEVGGVGGRAEVVRCHRGAWGCCLSAMGGVQS